ncbi:AGAP002274-PA-like protein [Anopheles sinensis]|uniref:AGAP002274-PA-like protein n=1 Tax=Anopheles sinensis TaxID=74873 RepID=A0A084W9D6_ANOSI|nr:AGAP002274-PA-like protein [Anopheles sinensis]
MQLAETQNFRYPYEDRLEDIKEEDTDFEVGSSRIGSIKDSFSSTPDYDLLAKRMASREHDDISMSSLQEFENLEHVISLENRKMQQGSQDSLSNGSFTRRFVQRGVHGDDISLSSLKEFEGLENACIEAHLIEIKAKEEAALLLSRSDESNKSDRSNGAKRSPPTTTVGPLSGGGKSDATGASTTHVVTTSSNASATVLGDPSERTVGVKVEKRTSSSDVSRDSLSGTTTTTTVTTISHESQVRQVLDEEDTSSHLVLTVSSDSLDGSKAPKVPPPPARDTLPSAHSSSDSLEINNRNVDVMTSSIDSIEFSKTGIATTRSSQSDSIEHMLGQQQPHRSDSTDSIEAQLHQKLLQQQQTGASKSRTLSDAKRDSLESLACSSDNQSGFSSPTKSAHGTQRVIGPDGSGVGYSQHTIMHTQAIHSTSTSIGGPMQKDISADSLTGPDAAFLTSTESLETSSTATNATYQNETDSQMSSSVTSCDSITMVDTLGPLHGSAMGMGDFDVFGSSATGGFGGSTMTSSISAAAAASATYSSTSGSFSSSSFTTTSTSATSVSSSSSQQQQVFRSSHMGAAVSSSSTVTAAVSSSSSTLASAYRVQQQQMMGDIELLSSEMFPGDIAFDEVKETAKERLHSKSTEKED